MRIHGLLMKVQRLLTFSPGFAAKLSFSSYFFFSFFHFFVDIITTNVFRKNFFAFPFSRPPVDVFLAWIYSLKYILYTRVKFPINSQIIINRLSDSLPVEFSFSLFRIR